LFGTTGIRRLAALGVIGFAAVAAIVVLLATGNSPTSHRLTLPTRRAPLISIIEADSQLRTDPSGTLETLANLGVGAVKVYVDWAAMAPDAASRRSPPQFDAGNPDAYPPGVWAPFDAIVRDAHRVGITVDLGVSGPAPLWATGRGAPSHANPAVWKPSASAYGLFVRALGQRYSGHYTPPGASTPLPRVDFWSIWNEPNYGVDLTPQAIDDWMVEISPSIYRGMVGAAWSALGATGHSRDTILIGELAPRGVRAADGMTPLRFLRALYCVDSNYRPLTGTAAAARDCPTTAADSSAFDGDNPALFGASGIAIHPYPQGLAPNIPTPGQPDYADLPVMPNVERVLDRLQLAYGSHRRLPIYSTEYGYKTNPPYQGGVPLQTTAYYLNWAEYISWRDPRIRSYDQYLLTDPPPTGSSQFDTGISFYNNQPKPDVYDAYRMPLYMPVRKVTAGQPLEVWGCVRPAPHAHRSTRRPQHAEISFQRQGTQAPVTVADVRLHPQTCDFDTSVKFSGPGLVQVHWTDPNGDHLHSRTVTLTAG
jgi:hypothetical protein